MTMPADMVYDETTARWIPRVAVEDLIPQQPDPRRYPVTPADEED